jgi:hypothetical protein
VKFRIAIWLLLAAADTNRQLVETDQGSVADAVEP